MNLIMCAHAYCTYMTGVKRKVPVENINKVRLIVYPCLSVSGRKYCSATFSLSPQKKPDGSSLEKLRTDAIYFLCFDDLMKAFLSLLLLLIDTFFSLLFLLLFGAHP